MIFQMPQKLHSADVPISASSLRQKIPDGDLVEEESLLAQLKAGGLWRIGNVNAAVRQIGLSTHLGRHGPENEVLENPDMLGTYRCRIYEHLYLGLELGVKKKPTIKC